MSRYASARLALGSRGGHAFDARFLAGGIEQPKTASVIGLFRRDGSAGSRTSSETSLHRQGSESPPSGPMSILLIEEGVAGDPLGMTPPSGPGSGAGSGSAVGRRALAGRRGSLLELSTSVDPIPEEDAHSGKGPWPWPCRVVVTSSPYLLCGRSRRLARNADFKKKGSFHKINLKL